MIRKLGIVEPAPPWSFGAALMSLIALFLALLIGSTLAQAILPDRPVALLVGWSIGALLGVFFVTMTYRRSMEGHTALRLGAARARLPIIMLLCVGLGMAFDLLSLMVTGDFWPAPELLGYFTTTPDGTLAVRADVGPAAWLCAFIFLPVLQPLAEELVFRGVLFPALRTTLGAWSGLLMTAAFYAAFHMLAYTPQPAPEAADSTLLWFILGVPLLDGLTITAVRAYTGSTHAAIVAHAAFGLFAVLKALALTG